MKSAHPMAVAVAVLLPLVVGLNAKSENDLRAKNMRLQDAIFHAWNTKEGEPDARWTDDGFEFRTDQFGHVQLFYPLDGWQYVRDSDATQCTTDTDCEMRYGVSDPTDTY
jgi:hypothetical protein